MRSAPTSPTVSIAALSALACTAALAQTPPSAVATRGPAAPMVGTRAAGLSTPQQSLPSLPLALEGYCPVSLHDRREWIAGRPESAAAFDGRWYYFASERERAIFAAAPETYAPVFGGDCLVTFNATGERTPGDLQHGILLNDRLYFFADSQRAAQFQKEPKKHTEADLFRGGVCPVTYATTSQATPGDPETQLTYAGGWRFLFVDAAARRRFLAAPEHFLDDSFAPQLQQSAAGHAFASPRAELTTTAPGNGIALPGSQQRAALPTAPGTTVPGGRTADNATTPTVASEPMLSGHCPVSVWTRPADPWVRGRYDQRLPFESMMFLPASPSERELFDADPALYIPALGGDCVVTYAETGKRVKGTLYHAVVDVDSHRLFLCADEAAAARLQEEAAAAKANGEPSRYMLIDCAAGGKCAVSRRDKGVDVLGDPKVGVWFEGQRYLFVDEAARNQFLGDVETYTAPIGDQ